MASTEPIAPPASAANAQIAALVCSVAFAADTLDSITTEHALDEARSMTRRAALALLTGLYPEASDDALLDAFTVLES